ncbi:MAG: acylphosphatase [Dehalococcoidales bacterium]|nr:acylphosphatase [Dehalococcoidales bacterium]
MAGLASVRVLVYGRVQGVFFRDFTLRQAQKLGVTGYVRNLPSGEAVEVQAEGEKPQLEKLIDYLKTGPPGARVANIVTSWSGYNNSYARFVIKH